MKLHRAFQLLAGASLAFYSTAHAQIIYSGPQDIAISAITFPDISPFKIDFNDDGIFDLDFFFRGPTPELIMVGALNDGAYAGASSIVTDFITAGELIDGSRTWWTPSLAGDLNLTIGPRAFGPFSGKRGFVGARFAIGLNNYYGWVDYAGNSSTPTGGTVLGWAYESTANRAITAGAGAGTAVPEPGTYGLAAVGFIIGLGLFRRTTNRGQISNLAKFP